MDDGNSPIKQIVSQLEAHGLEVEVVDKNPPEKIKEHLGAALEPVGGNEMLMIEILGLMPESWKDPQNPTSTKDSQPTTPKKNFMKW